MLKLVTLFVNTGSLYGYHVELFKMFPYSIFMKGLFSFFTCTTPGICPYLRVVSTFHFVILICSNT